MQVCCRCSPEELRRWCTSFLRRGGGHSLLCHPSVAPVRFAALPVDFPASWWRIHRTTHFVRPRHHLRQVSTPSTHRDDLGTCRVSLGANAGCQRPLLGSATISLSLSLSLLRSQVISIRPAIVDADSLLLCLSDCTFGFLPLHLTAALESTVNYAVSLRGQHSCGPNSSSSRISPPPSSHVFRGRCDLE